LRQNLQVFKKLQLFIFWVHFLSAHSIFK